MSSVIASLRDERRAKRDLTVLTLLSDGRSQREIAEQLRISTSTIRIIVKQHRRDTAADIEVPAWVPDRLHDDYRSIAAEDNEHAAASYCRRAKRDAVLSYGPVEHGVR